MQWIATAQQQADILTKPLNRLTFPTLRAKVMGNAAATTTQALVTAAIEKKRKEKKKS